MISFSSQGQQGILIIFIIELCALLQKDIKIKEKEQRISYELKIGPSKLMTYPLKKKNSINSLESTFEYENWKLTYMAKPLTEER